VFGSLLDAAPPSCIDLNFVLGIAIRSKLVRWVVREKCDEDGRYRQIYSDASIDIEMDVVLNIIREKEKRN
jgi:hypothetical protein